ncbi:hypothetical protein [Enterococcus sp. SMC-9]|uniref:hypothetical protein n=1 Tax=Enterococcus sp. SMC-9 TaxID=2862343 RepID=UPI001E52AB5E|nr:hypothetical protein [Enterococcus sp. SMC-9]MCD1025819.1 hypothetical protein [Enterococcus sp. SMC-9]
MNLIQIKPEQAIEMIKQGEHKKLWWKIGESNIVNNIGYQFPIVEKLLTTTWFVMEDTK